MKIYIYRHGETLYNSKGIVQGRGVDSSLNDKGIEQAQAFFEQHKTVPFDLVITSTLKRTKETAAPFQALNIPFEHRADLEEIGWGVFEGKPSDTEMKTVYLDLLKKWANGDSDARIEGGDSATEMGERLTQFTNYIKTLNHKNILVCTHGGCCAYLMAILQEQPLSAMPSYKHNNTGLCLFQYHKEADKFELIVHDDISHLE